jgi:hypothetical protein
MPPARQESYIEAFANLYRDAADITQVRFVAAAVGSQEKGGAWQPL